MDQAVERYDEQAPERQEVTVRSDEPAANLMALIERVATNPDLPMERFERLLKMKQDIDDRERDLERQAKAEQAEREFDAAMADCQAKIPVVLKKKRNEQTRSNYADLAAIADTAMPIVHDHGFTLSFAPKTAPDGFEGLRLQYRLAHKGGHVEKGDVDIPMSTQGAKGGTVMTGTHAFGSAATYGRRYLTCMLFNIATGDDDGNRAGQETDPPITADQYQELRGLIEESGADEAGLLKFLDVEHLELLTFSGFRKALPPLRAKLAKAREGADA